MACRWSKDAHNGAPARYLLEAEDTNNGSAAVLMELGGDGEMACYVQIGRAQPDWQELDKE